MSDMVNHPSHYADKCSIECIEYMRLVWGDYHTAFHCGETAQKYLHRYKFKNNPLEDVYKSLWYIKKSRELSSAVKGEELKFLTERLDILEENANNAIEELKNS